MNIHLLGHAAVALEDARGTLIIDPFESGGFGGAMAYPPISMRADWVVCTHEHLDHCAVHTLPGAPERVEQGCFGPFEIARVRAEHDEYGGRRRGGSVDLLEVRWGERRVVHLSDVGHSPRREQVERLRGADVLLVPAGGFFTIGAAQAREWAQRLAPRWVIPVHYKTPSCQLRLRGVECVEAYFPEARDFARRLDTCVFRVDVERAPGLWVPRMAPGAREMIGLGE